MKNYGQCTWNKIVELDLKIVCIKYEVPIGNFFVGKVTPFVGKRLKLIEEEYRNCLTVVHAGKGEFDVIKGCSNFTVKLRVQFCDCKGW